MWQIHFIFLGNIANLIIDSIKIHSQVRVIFWYRHLYFTLKLLILHLAQNSYSKVVVINHQLLPAWPRPWRKHILGRLDSEHISFRLSPIKENEKC